MREKENKAAFTLIELSIVLLIIGLVVGGVLVGQDLIKAAELRAVITDQDRHRAAIYTFRNKYNALPGDMKEATAYWGAANSTPSVCATTASTGMETCNGDGDRRISNFADVSTYYEWFRFWHHLSNAGLISGAYTGVAGSGGLADANIGENVPGNRMAGAGWTPRFLGRYGGDAVWFAANYQNFLVFGSEAPNWSTNDRILIPKDAHNIDLKMDDGRPGRGKVVAVLWDNCTNAANATDYSADYLLTTTSVECALAFLGAF